jgi:hypothetical protein
MFEDASQSKRPGLRVRADNPTEKVQPPDRGAKRAKAYLYPDELLKLLNDESISLDRRRA